MKFKFFLSELFKRKNEDVRLAVDAIERDPGPLKVPQDGTPYRVIGNVHPEDPGPLKVPFGDKPFTRG
jgi:hypothetical protein